ncbi:PorH family porin [Corynebacterium ureicelerivorans]
MPVDLKFIQTQLKNFSVFAKNLTELFQELPKALQTFVGKVTNTATDAD